MNVAAARRRCCCCCCCCCCWLLQVVLLNMAPICHTYIWQLPITLVHSLCLCINKIIHQIWGCLSENVNELPTECICCASAVYNLCPYTARSTYMHRPGMEAGQGPDKPTRVAGASELEAESEPLQLQPGFCFFVGEASKSLARRFRRPGRTFACVHDKSGPGVALGAYLFAANRLLKVSWRSFSISIQAVVATDMQQAVHWSR